MISTASGEVRLEARSLEKSYGAVRAIRGVSCLIHRGEVLGLVGDNGAGKTTLVKCLSGNIAPDGGSISVNGVEVHFESPQAARALGIETVHQDLVLLDPLDVAGNLFLNRELIKGWGPLRALGWLDNARMFVEARRILDELHINLPSVRAQVETLSGGQRQAIAVGRAVAWGQDIVLMDEPAAALGVEQSKLVLELIRTLSARGVAVLFISHNIEHVMEVCDRVVVLRHGRKVGDVAKASVTARDLVALITGASEWAP